MFELFRRCSTQWVLSPAGNRVGLNYASVLALAGVLGCADDETMTGIQSLELGALCAYAGRTEKELMGLLHGA